jgi:CubicO group peptidase (beta-lactamase class C family)|tara:strand:- start:554 stop:2080 length:1527 start_codon:yes stop_codon:yes gene_type:complete
MRKFILILSFLFFYLGADAQEKELPTFITDSLQSFINQGMKDWQIPGLSLAIIKNDDVVFIKGFGVTKLNGSKLVDENTLFMIGSNTKAFTSTTLSILQESGLLNLNDKVQKWMPEFRLKDTLASKEVNIVDLLSHRIGFETFQGDFTYWSSNLSRYQVIQKMSLIDAPYSFRTNWGYCNAAYVAAGELIPRIINKTWEETVKNSILLPLKMNRTLMLAEEMNSAPNAAYPHTKIDNNLVEIPIVNLNNVAPAGSMSSSAKDMTNWLFAQLNNGKIDGKQILSAKSVRAIRSPSSILGVDQRDNIETHFHLYGMGLYINDYNGKLVYSHTGGVDGFLSSVMFIPEEKLGIVVLTNTDQNNFYQNLTDAIRDAFLGLPYQEYSKTSLEIFKQEKLKEDKRIDSLKKIVSQKFIPSLPLKKYSGKYFNEVYGDIEIKLENNKLNIYFSNHPKLIGRLEHIKNNTFLCSYSNSTFGIVEIPFQIKNDQVTWLTLRVSDFVELTPYEFSKIN